MCDVSCEHCDMARFDQRLVRCRLCGVWSHIVGTDMCLDETWAHTHGMVTLQEHCYRANGKVCGTSQTQI